MVRLASPGVIWISKADVSELNTLTSSQPGHIYFDDTPLRFGITLSSAIPESATLKIAICDLYGNTHNWSKPVNQIHGIYRYGGIIVFPRDHEYRRGMFRSVTLICDQLGRTLSTSSDCAFSVLPRPRDIDPRKSFFGIHMQLTPENYEIARAIGARWVRLHDTAIETMGYEPAAARSVQLF
jgi:hypothetical protein